MMATACAICTACVMPACHRMPATCLRLDGQPCAPACHTARGRKDRTANAATRSSLCGPLQWPSRPYRHALGRALHVMLCGQRRLCTALLSLHRTQPFTRSSHRRCGRVSLVQLRSQSRPAGTLGTNAPSFFKTWVRVNFERCSKQQK